MRDHDGDIAALQAGLHIRRPARTGLRLYTTDFDSVSFSDFYRGRQAFLLLAGPSMATHELGRLNQRGIVTMGVNNSWALYRPTLWTCVDDPGRLRLGHGILPGDLLSRSRGALRHVADVIAI